MGTDTLDLQDADDIIMIIIKEGEIQVKSSVDSKVEFDHIMEIVSQMAEDYYPEDNVDNLH